MAEAAEDNRFIHGMGARAIALVIGVGVLGYMFTTWGDEMQALVAAEDSAPLVTPVGEERVSKPNPALDACLEQRVGHVDQMLKDGVIGEHQHGQFAIRARQLCVAQNPA